MDNSFIEVEPVLHGPDSAVFKVHVGVTVEPEQIPIEAFVLQFVDALDFGFEVVEFVLLRVLEWTASL